MMTAGIAGDGIVGQLLAFALLHAGWNVTLFSSGKQPNCSMAAAGLLTPIAELEKNDFIIFELGQEALLQHWPDILNKLSKEIYFKQLGSLVLCHHKDETDLKRFISAIDKKLNNSNNYQAMDRAKINKLEPEINNFHQGYYLSLEGQIDNQTLLKKMGTYLKKRITWMTNAFISHIFPGKIITNDEITEFDVTFDCRGLGAKTTFPELRGVRGELIWLYAPDVTIHRPIRYLHPRYNLYLAPRPQHVYLVGASEIETENERKISVRTALELLTAVYSIQPKFAEAQIIKTVTQCRPALPDNLPKIKYTEKFAAINGLYRHGFLIAPTLIVNVMQWLEHGITAVHHPQLFEAWIPDRAR
jgi:glycine oxidase